MILGDVEETVTTIEIDEETYEEIYKVRPKKGVNLSWQIFLFKTTLCYIVKVVYCWLFFEPSSNRIWTNWYESTQVI